MGRCLGTTAQGDQCRRLVRGQSRYCGQHGAQQMEKSLTWAGAGALLSQFVAPGIGPALVGAVAGAVAAEPSGSGGKPRVFVSFDFDNDQKYKHLLVGQTRNRSTPFEIRDHSLKEAAPERNWKSKARTAIRRSDLVLVILGRDTHRAPGVLAEVRMALEEGKPIVQLISQPELRLKRVPGAGRTLQWTWANLSNLFPAQHSV